LEEIREGNQRYVDWRTTIILHTGRHPQSYDGNGNDGNARTRSDRTKSTDCSISASLASASICGGDISSELRLRMTMSIPYNVKVYEKMHG